MNEGVGDSRVEFRGSDSGLSLPGLASAWGGSSLRMRWKNMELGEKELP